MERLRQISTSRLAPGKQGALDDMPDSPGHRYLETNVRFRDLHLGELGLGQHLLKLLFGVSALEQHGLERELGHDAVECGKAHLVDVTADLGGAGVSAQVDDHAPAARLQNTAHLLESGDRLSKILKRRTAEKK